MKKTLRADIHISINRDGTKRYYVNVFVQPWFRHLAARAYHWYDMSKFSMWAVRHIEKVQDRLFADDMDRLPFGPAQDVRCFHLSQKDRVVLATIEVDEKTYNMLDSRQKNE